MRPLVDTHCHVDLYPDPGAVIEAVERARTYVLAVTTTPSVFPAMVSLVGESKYVRPALGLHPELVAERWRELPLWVRLLPETRYIGEVGLDYSVGDRIAHARQRHVLSEILTRCNEVGNKILTVHSRRAEDDVIAAVGTGFCGKVILHWFSGTGRALERAIANGCYISVNPAMVQSRKFLDLLPRVPRERILLETDGPFVTAKTKIPVLPTELGGVVRALATTWDISEDEARAKTFQNFAVCLQEDDSDG